MLHVAHVHAFAGASWFASAAIPHSPYRHDCWSTACAPTQAAPSADILPCGRKRTAGWCPHERTDMRDHRSRISRATGRLSRLHLLNEEGHEAT